MIAAVRSFMASCRVGVVAIAALAIGLGMSLPASAGGPLELVSHLPVVYANGGTSLTLNLDQGTLGTRTNAQAVALVQSAVSLWNGVGTSTLRLNIGPQLGADYTRLNYANILDRYNDGVNPVVFDTDGSLTDLLFGVGAKSSVLGFAGSAYYTSGPLVGKFAEGQSVLNGYIPISDATWTVVLAHEFGHFFGLDHSQLDNAQGLSTSNYVLMYPIAYRSLATLHEDDIAAVSTLYPSASFNAVYGTLTGNFTSASGTPILGVNIWAQEVNTGRVYSNVSDYLMQGNGAFRLTLPSGTYTLHAESIQSRFTSGSGVGPYSSSSTDISFQAPNPITPVQFGSGGGQQIVIVAGCAANAAFRIDGTGTVTGNCPNVAPPGTAVTIGVYRPSTSTFYLRRSNSAGFADLTIPFGDPGDVPLAGDWDGNGTTTIGLYRPSTSTFYLRNSNSVGFADIAVPFGNPGDIPVVGDWDGNGTTTIGVYRPSTRVFYLRNSNNSGFADLTIPFGDPGDKPLAGDWDGNGTTTIGLYRPGTRTFYLRNSNTVGFADVTVPFGDTGDVAIAGDWDGNGTSTIGLYRPGTNTFYLRNSNTAGPGETVFQYGIPNDVPIVGRWN